MACPPKCVLGDDLVFSIATHDPDTGILTDVDSAPSYRIYKDEVGQVYPSAGAAGTMAKLDDANTTGFYAALVPCTSGNGFETHRTYTVYIEATVDGDTGGICYAFKLTSEPPGEITEVLRRAAEADDVMRRSEGGTDSLRRAITSSDVLRRN